MRRRCAPTTPLGNARMRYWNKFIDEHVMNYVSMHGWHRMVGVIARGIETGEFEQAGGAHPAARAAREMEDGALGLLEADLANATAQDRGRGRQGRGAARKTAWLAGDTYTLADINFFSHCGMMVERMFPEMEIAGRCPRLVDWRERVTARPAAQRRSPCPTIPRRAFAPGAARARHMAPPVIARSVARRQSSGSPRPALDCFAPLAMTAV